jgi:DnaD/phage-associated family protein
MDMKASGYIMKPVTAEEVKEELEDLRFPIIPKSNALLRVQCFGNFDVFTPDGAHVRFERSKAKEVFAYLVHKQGSSCTTREIFAAIFEDEPYEKKLQNLLQTRGRNLTAGEEKYATGWLEMGFEDDVITMAYERTCLNTGGLNWAYMNKILQRWHEAGLHTAEAVRSGDRKPGTAPAAGQRQLDADEIAAIQRMMKEG